MQNVEQRMTATQQTNPPEGIPAAPIRLNSDPLDWPRIPKPVKEKLRRLRRARADAWLVWRAIADERQAAWEAKRVADARLKVLTGGRSDSPLYAQYSNFYRLADDDPQVVAQLEALADAKANIERLDPLVAARSQQFGQFDRLLSSIEGYLREGLSGVGDAIKLHKGPAPSPRKGESLADAVERCRRRLRELDADRHRIACAPWHSATAKQRARAEVEKLAERGRPNVLSLIESCDKSIRWAECTFSDVIIGGRLVTATGDPSALPLLFWLHRAPLIERIETEIDALADDANALTAEQRSEKIGEIDRDRLAIQREEEHWVSKVIEEGGNMLRRSDSDPRAVLGLADNMPDPMNP